MKVRINKQADKFIESINEPEKSLLLSKIKLLVNSIKERDLPQLSQLDIKNLKGNWKGWQRLRVGNMRVIFSITSDEIIIEVINHRGNLY